jgi:hypothetical protein
MRHRGRYDMCWLTAHERGAGASLLPAMPVDRLADTDGLRAPVSMRNVQRESRPERSGLNAM